MRTIAKVPLRRGDVDVEFDQEMLAELLDQLPFNMAIANLYKTRFNGVPGVIYAAGVRHAYNVAESLREEGIKAQAVSGETPKRELAEILAAYERGEIDVLVNAQLLAEGWNSPRATVCMHLAPTASRRIYQQRVGRVTRRHPGKEAGVVVDFVHPATKHDDPVITLHSLLDRDVYRGGAIVVGPVRRGRGRRVRVERRVIPVTAEEERRHEVFERELWRIAVEHLDYGEQHMWAALAGARVAPSGWRRARAMLHFDRTGELKRRFLLTAVERNRNAQLRVRALQEIAAAKDAEAFDLSIDVIGTWAREERREGAKVMLQALAEKRIGRRDQANAWIWRLAEYTREVHEEYAVQRWPETKRLLGLLVNSSGGAHARNARRLVHAARKQDRRLQAALLAAAVAHTPEAEEVLRGARTRLARKPSALSRELLRNFPKGKGRRSRRRRKKAAAGGGAAPGAARRRSARARRPTSRCSTRPSRPRRRRRRRRHGATARRAEQADGRRDGDERRAEARARPRPPPAPAQGRRPRAHGRRGLRRRRRRRARRGHERARGRRPEGRGRGPGEPEHGGRGVGCARRRAAGQEAQAAPCEAGGAGRHDRAATPASRTPAPMARTPAPTTSPPRSPSPAARPQEAGRREDADPAGSPAEAACRRSSASLCPASAGAEPAPHAQQMHLARAQRGAPAAAQLDHQAPVPVDAGRAPAAVGPRDLAAAQRVARAIGLQQRRRLERQRALERGEQRARASARGRRASAPACPPVACSSAGSSSTRSATLRPIPSTAQPSCGRPSARIPATLRPVDQHVVGPLDPRVGPADLGHGDAPRRAAAAAGGSRRTSDISSALPGGARPRAALAPAPGASARRR